VPNGARLTVAAGASLPVARGTRRAISSKSFSSTQRVNPPPALVGRAAVFDRTRQTFTGRVIANQSILLKALVAIVILLRRVDEKLLEEMARRVRARPESDAPAATVKRAAVRHDQTGDGSAVTF